MSKILNSLELIDLLSSIKCSNTNETTVAKTTNKSSDIRDEIKRLRNLLDLKFAKRFPELCKLVTNDFDFANCVLFFGGKQNLVRAAEELKNAEFELPAAVRLVITVSSASSAGIPLTDEEWDTCKLLASDIVALYNVRNTLLEYLKREISMLAPNLAAIVGTEIAARLISAAGGVQALSEIPACNVLVMGREERRSELGRKHAGIVYDTDLVSSVPRDFARKVARLVAAKVCLAARIDRGTVNAGSDEQGKLLRHEISGKIDKLLQPPPGVKTKALPIPGEQAKKKRGGRRARAIKAKFAPTEMAKAQNRMAFGVPETEIVAFDDSKGLGMAPAVALKKPLAAKKQTDYGISRAMQMSKLLNLPEEQLHHPLSTESKVGTVSGLATSLAFTPVQGIELANPVVEQKNPTSSKWF